MKACHPYTRESIHLAGALDALDSAIRLEQITTPIWSLTGASCCCRNPSPNNRVTVDGVVVQRFSAGPVFSSSPPIPDGLLITTLRSIPWVKVRISSCVDGRGNCGPGGPRPVWIDFGQSILVPWRTVGITLMGRQGWGEVQRPEQQFPPPVAGFHNRFDVFANVTIACTECCEGRCAILTDSQEGAEEPAGEASFLVPPFARALSFATSGAGPITLQWINIVAILSAMTSDLGRPIDVAHVPDASSLFVSVGDAGALMSAAWEICL